MNKIIYFLLSNFIVFKCAHLFPSQLPDYLTNSFTNHFLVYSIYTLTGYVRLFCIGYRGTGNSSSLGVVLSKRARPAHIRSATLSNRKAALFSGRFDHN